MSHIISIFIPGNIQPLERGERFADPLQAALERENLGEVFEEGTHLETVEDRQVVKGCQLEIEVKNLRKGLALIKQTLVEGNAPTEATITVAGKGEPQVFKLVELANKPRAV
jgi:hypothetical protein